jgi:hypothetical protein
MANDRTVLAGLGEDFETPNDQAGDGHNALIGRRQEAREDDRTDETEQPRTPAQTYRPGGATDQVPLKARFFTGSRHLGGSIGRCGSL